MSETTGQAGNGKSRAAKWRAFALNLLLIVVVVSGIRGWQQRDMPAGPAPVLHGTTLAGMPYELREHLQRPVLVHFWATWCSVCRAEESNIAAAARAHGNVITVAMQSGTAADIAEYMKQQVLNFPVLNDASGAISAAWGVHAVPASFIIGTDGSIRFVEVGYTTELGLRLRLWWAGD